MLLAGLSDREAGILSLVAEGLSNKEVAKRLALQEKTVKHHMTRVFAKLNVRNRTEAALLMHQARKRPWLTLLASKPTESEFAIEPYSRIR